MLLARPHSSEAMTNRNVAHMNSLRSPKWRVSQPVSGKAIALLTAKDVITHVAWLALPPRLPEIVGRDTFAIVRSSTCMNDASARPERGQRDVGGRNIGGAGLAWAWDACRCASSGFVTPRCAAEHQCFVRMRERQPWPCARFSRTMF
jgi:hypothetical protein